MGKATITGGGQDGSYTITVNYNRTRAAAEIAKLQIENADLAARASEQQATVNSLRIERDYQVQVLDAAISSKDQAAIQSATEALGQAVAALTNAEQVLRILNLQQVANDKRIGYLQTKVPPDPNQQAWCADFNENLTGEVGTIELGRTAVGGILIRPGGENGDQAGHDHARDGQLQHIAASPPAGAFYNYAMLPGAAKWKPRYRTGTLTAVDTEAHTADVTIDALTSSHQGLDVNQTGSLTAVPVSYLWCHAVAFSPGDQVVVEFDTAGNPTVIGFAAGPKSCEPRYLILKIAGHDWPTGYLVNWPETFYAVFDTRTGTALASVPHPDTGTPIALPATGENLQPWLDARTVRFQTPIYSWEEAGKTAPIVDIPSRNSVSPNTGCGTLYDVDVTDGGGTQHKLWVAANKASILGFPVDRPEFESYNATVNIGPNAGQTTCWRSEAESWVNGGTGQEDKYKRWHTPMGQLDEVKWLLTKTSILTIRLAEHIGPISWQIYGVEIPYTTSKAPGAPWYRRLTVKAYFKRHITGAAADYDPFTMPASAALEQAVKDLIEYARTQLGLNDDSLSLFTHYTDDSSVDWKGWYQGLPFLTVQPAI